MDFIKEWVLCVCITLIISVVFSLLTPKGNMGKIYKIILAMFIFVSFILPLGNSDFDFELPEMDFEISESQNESYENIVKSNVETVLKQGGYESCIIECDVEYSNEEIYVNSLKISVPSQYDNEEIKNYIYDKLGMVAEVYYLGD